MDVIILIANYLKNTNFIKNFANYYKILLYYKEIVDKNNYIKIFLLLF